NTRSKRDWSSDVCSSDLDFVRIPARLSGYSFAAALVIGKDYHRGSRRRFCAMSGKHLWPDIVFAPCRGNASGPTSFLHHVGETPLARHRFCAMSGEHLWPDVVSVPSRENLCSCRCSPEKARAPPHHNIQTRKHPSVA